MLTRNASKLPLKGWVEVTQIERHTGNKPVLDQRHHGNFEELKIVQYIRIIMQERREEIKLER
jgi:hypothetical protein